MEYEFYKAYGHKQRKRAGIYLFICTIFVLAETAGIIFIKSDARYFFACILPFWLKLEIGLFLMWLDHKNRYIAKKQNLIYYRNLFGIKKEFSFSEISEVFVNQYGKVSFKGKDKKTILAGNISEIPGILELAILLKEHNVKFQFKVEEMRKAFMQMEKVP